MKEVYIVFIASDYKIGKLIRRVTGAKYNHVALSDKSDLSMMYSFARKYNLTPLVGGFVTELPHRYLRKAGSDVPVKVCRIELSDSEYSEARERFERVKNDKHRMKYNYLSAITYPHERLVSVRDAYTCVEFVQYVLGISGYISLEELQERYAEGLIYEGGIRGIIRCGSQNDDYYSYHSQVLGFLHFLGDFFTVCKRAVFK